MSVLQKSLHCLYLLLFLITSNGAQAAEPFRFTVMMHVMRVAPCIGGSACG
jgi:hypothetical protein